MAAPLLFTPTEGAYMQGFDGALEKNAARRAENRKNLIELSNMMADQGVAMGIDDMAAQARSLLGAGDFLNSTALSSDMVEAIRRTQNQRAALVTEQRRRDQFNADLNESNAIEAEVQKQAESGKSEGEIAAWLMQSYGERGQRVIPRLGALMNRATISGQQSGFNLGANLHSEEEAQSYIKANPSLTPSMREGVLQRARQNVTESEKHVWTIGREFGGTGGFVGDEKDRASIDAMIPGYITNPARRAQLVEKAMKIAISTAQNKLAAEQAAVINKVQTAWGVNAPAEAAGMAAAQQADQDRRGRTAQEQEKGMLSVLSAQDSARDLLVKDKKTPEDVKQRVAAILSERVVGDIDGLVQAVQRKDSAAVDRILARSPSRSSFVERARRVSSFVNNGDKFPSADAAMADIQDIVVDQREIGAAGSAYRKYLDSAGAAANAPVKYEKREVIVTYPINGRVNGTRKEIREVPVGPANMTEQQAVSAKTASDIWAGFVKDASEMLIASQRVLQATGRFDTTPEQAQQAVYDLAIKQATVFVASAGLSGNAARAEVERLVAAIMTNVGVLTGTRRVPTAVENYEENMKRMRSQGGVLSPSNVVPGAVQPSPRLNTPF